MDTCGGDWRPSCSLEALRQRAALLQKIRQFFAAKDVMEVETPLLSAAIGTDPNLDFFTTDYRYLPSPQTMFLQTSPEFAMKRLLAAGSGSIFQICKAFRNGESGRFHNPEFTLLEWYRIGFNLSQLMDEVAELMQVLFAESGLIKAVRRISYVSLFEEVTGLNPLVFSYEQYCHFARTHNLVDGIAVCGQAHGFWLDFIFSQKIQPEFEPDTLWMVYGYPAVLSSLARSNPINPLVSERVEVFMNGIELGNGYDELTDTEEQAQRFTQEIAVRKAAQRPDVISDNRLLAALEYGLPDCAGIAIGLDRVLMLLKKQGSIADVLAFPISKS